MTGAPVLPDPSLPHSVEAERAVVGSILLDNGLAAQARLLLEPEDFYVRAHQFAFRALLALDARGSAIDPLLLSEEMQRAGVLEQVGGMAFIGELTYGLPHYANLEAYTKVIRGHSLARQIVKTAYKIVSEALDGEDGAEATLRRAEQQFADLRATRPADASRIRSAEQVLSKHFAEPKWVVPGLLPEGAYILAGRPKLGKSWAALGVGVAVASGGFAFGSIKVERGDVLYLALEDGERRCQSRLKGMLHGDVMPVGLDFAFVWPRLDAGGLAELEGWLRQHPDARLVVIDTLKRVRQQERAHSRLYDTDYDALAPLCDLARKYSVTILVVHHTRKADSDDPLDLISGSTGLTASVDGALVLKRARGESEATLHAFCRDLEENKEIALRWNGQLNNWKALGDAAEVRRSKERQEIISLLIAQTAPLKPKAIAEMLGREYRAIKALLWKMMQDGEVHTKGDGGYFVTGKSVNSVDRVTPLTPLTPLTGPLLAADDSWNDF